MLICNASMLLFIFCSFSSRILVSCLTSSRDMSFSISLNCYRSIIIFIDHSSSQKMNSLQRNERNQYPQEILSIKYDVTLYDRLTMQQNQSIGRRFCRSLTAEDFVILSEENKHYRSLLSALTEKEAILSQQVQDLTRKLQRTENEKEEYRLKNSEFSAKLGHYELVRQELSKEYRLLKREIEQRVSSKTSKEQQNVTLLLKLQSANEAVMRLQQENKHKQIVIEQLNESLGRLQRQLLDKKLRIFSNMLDGSAPHGTTKIKSKKKQSIINDKTLNKINFKEKPMLNDRTLITQKPPSQDKTREDRTNSNTRSLGISDINSISFSLVSNQSSINRGNSRARSIYL